MTMREGSPACVPPGNRGGLVLTCLTLVAFFVTNTSGSHQVQSDTSRQPSPALPESMPSQFNSSSDAANPPTTATFLMECPSPADDIYDHCWLDDNTLVSVRYGKVLKFTVDRETTTCTLSELDSFPSATRVACSPDGQEIYVIDYGQSYLWVYDRNNLKAIWTPDGLVGKPFTVAINSQRVMVGTYERGPVYMYNRDRVYLGQIKILQNRYKFDYTHLTEEGLYVASTATDGYRLIIHNINKGSTVSVGGKGSDNGQFTLPLGVGTVGDYILVCDSNNHRLPVFYENGRFQSNLQFKGTDVSNPWSVDYRSGTKLLAVNTRSDDKIKIFLLA